MHIRPTIAAVYVTSYCNSRCTMCNFWRNERDSHELNSEQWGVIFSKLKAFGVDFIGVNASGEMFTRRDIFDILGHLYDLKIPFGVNSNGTLFTLAKAKQLAQLNPRAVTLGIDGIGNDAYQATRGLAKGFSKVSHHIDHLKQAGIRNIGLGTVLMASNVMHWFPLAEWAYQKGLAGIRFTAHHDNYFAPNSVLTDTFPSDAIFLEEADRQIERLIELKRRTGIIRNSETYLRRVVDFYRNPKGYFPAPCLQGSNRIEVDVYGNVTLCSFASKALGNLCQQEMVDIWQSPIHLRAREDAYIGRCPRCFLSCYAEENLRLSRNGFFPTLEESLKRGWRLLVP